MWQVLDGVQIQVFVIAVDSSTWELAIPCSCEGKSESKVLRFLIGIYNSYVK
jgi:hypothetical protein